MPLLANLSIAHTVEYSAVNRVVAGKVQLGDPKDVTINSLSMTQGGPLRVLADFAH